MLPSVSWDWSERRSSSSGRASVWSRSMSDSVSLSRTKSRTVEPWLVALEGRCAWGGDTGRSLKDILNKTTRIKKRVESVFFRKRQYYIENQIWCIENFSYKIMTRNHKMQDQPKWAHGPTALRLLIFEIASPSKRRLLSSLLWSIRCSSLSLAMQTSTY